MQRTAFIRAMVVAIVVVDSLATGAWEYHRSRDLEPSRRRVVKVERVVSGGKGESKEFTIEHFVDGKRHTFTARRGIIDSFGAFRGLTNGSPVSIAVDTRDPSRAILNSFSARYPLTLTFGAVSLIFLVTILGMAVKARLA